MPVPNKRDDAIERAHPSLDERFDPSIRIVPYDPEWPREFDGEERVIRWELGDLAASIEHVGSTAVPDMPSKPIIDIQVSVVRLEPRSAYVRSLERLGYLYASDPGSLDYHFFAKPPDRPRRFHVHVCEVGSEHERRHLAVRDFLRSHPDEAAEYAGLKREIVRRRPNDRLAYIEEKEPFMGQLERRALEWRRDEDPR